MGGCCGKNPNSIPGTLHFRPGIQENLGYVAFSGPASPNNNGQGPMV
jgi:hypothetical protein